MLWPWPPLWLLFFLHFVPLPLPPELPLLSLDSSLAALSCFPGSVLSLHQAVLSLYSSLCLSLSPVNLCVLCLLCLFAFSLRAFLFSPGHLLSVPVSLMSLFFLESLFSTQTHRHRRDTPANRQTQIHTCRHRHTCRHTQIHRDTHRHACRHVYRSTDRRPTDTHTDACRPPPPADTHRYTQIHTRLALVFQFLPALLPTSPGCSLVPGSGPHPSRYRAAELTPPPADPALPLQGSPEQGPVLGGHTQTQASSHLGATGRGEQEGTQAMLALQRKRNP